ncbi:MAG: hypothetical protein ACOCW6_09840 [Spirochaetota bacterium]
MVSPKALRRLAFGLVAVLLLSGCLTLESTVRLNDDGSGRLSLVYSVSEQLYDYGVFDEESTHRVLPLSRRDFELSAISTEGVRLADYDSSRRDGIVTIEADLEFETVEGLAGLLNVSPETLASGDGGSILRLPLFSGFEGPVDTDMVEEFWNEVRFVHRVALPDQIRSVNLGEISENGREAVVDVRLIELIEVGGPVVWEVAW